MSRPARWAGRAHAKKTCQAGYYRNDRAPQPRTPPSEPTMRTGRLNERASQRRRSEARSEFGDKRSREQQGGTVTTRHLSARKTLVVLSGRAYPELADEIAADIGITVTSTTARDFSNGETFIKP